MYHSILYVANSQIVGLHCKKKGYRFPRRAVMIKLFPASESLVSDIPAGDRKIANLFYSVPYTKLDESETLKKPSGSGS
jgi:hypothetical protein